jgi:WD40 repeat protein
VNQKIIQTLPLQVYSSALAFTPLESRIYSTYEPCFRQSLPRVILGRLTSNANNVVFAKDSWRVSRVAHSSDGHLLISAIAGSRESEEGGVLAIWDVHTGANLLNFKLKEARRECHGVTFLPGNEVIVSVWEDNRLYHLQCRSRSLLHSPIKLDLNGQITCIAWAPDWACVVCGTGGGRIHRFSLRTGRKIGQPKAAHEKEITSVSFSHDGKTLASTSRDMTFKIWNVTSDDLTGPVIVCDHTQPIEQGAFHPTTASFFAFVDGKSLFIYNTAAKKVELHYGSLKAESFVFSQDGKQMAVQDLDDGKSITLLLSVEGAEDGKMTRTKL